MAKTKISQFDANAANNTDLNSISIAEGTAPSNINNAIRELMSQLADLNLGNEVLSTLKIDNLHLDGNTIITLDTNGDLNLTPNGTGSVVIAKADINGGAIDGTPIGGASASTGAFSTLSASSTVGLGSSVTISGGNIDGVIGANTPAAITGTVITANTNFAGNLTGNVTGNIDGIVGGSTPAAITGTTITANTKFVGALEGNVTAASGTSTFNNVTINGTLDMDSTTSQTITGLATPSGSTDAATKGYVDTEVSALVDSAPATLNTLNELAAALGDDANYATTTTNSIAAKLPLAGGTMTGDINANSNTVSGLKAPSGANDATTKTYVDTADALKLNLSGGTLSGNLAMGSNKVTGLDTPTATGDATTKGYVDGILGSATAAATSASAAATSATASGTSATASANSATASASSATSAAASYDSFDDRYLGAKGSAPTVDNDGDALLTGALYFNTSSNQLFVWTSGDAWTQAAFTASGFLSGSNNLSDVASASTSRTNLGLAIGSNVQAFDADLSALAGLTSAADKGIQFTGSGTAATYDLTSAGKALLDDADAAAQRTTLGLGSASTLTAGTSANNAVQLDGSAKLPAVDGSALTGMASGGTVSLVADGNITAGKPTILTAAGKAQQISSTTTGNNVTEGFGTTTNFVGNSVNYSPKTLAVIGTDKVATIYCDESNSDYPTVQIGTVNGSTNAITWGSKQVVKSTAANKSGVVYKSSDSTLGLMYGGSAYAGVFGATVSGTNISLSSELSLSVTNTNMYGAMHDPDTDEMVVWIMDYISSNRRLKSFAVNLDGTNTPTLSHSHETGNVDNTWWGSGTQLAYTYDTNTNVFILTGEKDEPDSAIRFFVQTNSGSAFTTTERTKSISGFKGYGVFCFDSTNNKVVYAYGDSSNDVSVVNLTMAATDFTVGTPNQMTSLINETSYLWLAYDPSSERVVCITAGGNNTSNTWNIMSNNGTALTQVSSGTWGSTTQTYYAGKGGITQTAMTGLTSNPIVLATDTAVSATTFAGAFSVGQTEVTTTNLTTANYLGVAAETISDTNTGKITVNGGVNENQSSLTIGNHYFTNGNGVVGLVGSTTGEQYLGKAIAADKIQLLENEGYAYGTAEGAVTAGKPIFVESDGDFFTPTSTTATTTYSAGTRTEIIAGTINTVVGNDFDASAERFVVSYLDGANSNRTSVKLVSVASDKAISVTATQELDTVSYGMENAQVIYDPNAEKTLIVYQDGGNSNDLRCRVLTIGASSVTVGSEVTIDDSNSTGTDINLCYDTTNNKIIVYTRDQSNSNYPTVYVGSISGTTPSFGAAQVVISEGVTNLLDCAFGGDKFIFTYDDSDYDGSGKAGSLSGTTMSFGNEFEFETNNPDNFNAKAVSACYDSVNDRFVQFFKHSGAGDPLNAKCIRVHDDNSTTIGAELLIGNSSNDNAGTLRKSNLGVVPVCYRQSTDIYYTEVTVDPSDNSLTKITGVLIGENISGMQSALAHDTANTRLLNVFEDHSQDDLDGIGIIPNSSVTTTTFPTSGKGFVGIATKDVSDNGQVEVATAGQIDAQQSGLTAGETYYAQSDGTLGTSADSNGSVIAGRALSATKLLIT